MNRDKTEMVLINPLFVGIAAGMKLALGSLYDRRLGPAPQVDFQ